MIKTLRIEGAYLNIIRAIHKTTDIILNAKSIFSAIWQDTGANFNILFKVLRNVSGKRNQRDTTRKGKSLIIPVYIQHGPKFKRLRRLYQQL